jgi:pyridoxal phosphate enzyme (YggS family)
MSDAAARLANVRARIAAAAARAGRAPDTVTLLGVAKRIASDTVADAVNAGLADLGENYVQEAVGRRAELMALLSPAARPAPRWHFIGKLQRNKARVVAEHFDVVHTLDREALGVALERHATALGKQLEVLVQVNTSGEAQKGGVSPEDVADLLAASRAWSHLRVAGLMTIPAAAEDPERTRPAFAALRGLRDGLRPEHPELAALSMGMSGDFEVAIEEGATIIRVGTALFGPRTRTEDVSGPEE